MGIKSIHIQNFKSIKDSGVVEFKPINVLIGANGAGKSNFISFFKFLNKLYTRELQVYIAQNGRADNFLFFGRKYSSYVGGTITFNNDYQNEYAFKLIPDQSGNLIFSEEWSNTTQGDLLIENKDKLESELKNHGRSGYLRDNLNTLKIFHF